MLFEGLCEEVMTVEKSKSLRRPRAWEDDVFCKLMRGETFKGCQSVNGSW